MFGIWRKVALRDLGATSHGPAAMAELGALVRPPEPEPAVSSLSTLAPSNTPPYTHRVSIRYNSRLLDWLRVVPLRKRSKHRDAGDQHYAFVLCGSEVLGVVPTLFARVSRHH